MKNLEKIITEIEDLQAQSADIIDAIGRLQEQNGIWCKNCQSCDVFCRRKVEFPACFQPGAEWLKWLENHINREGKNNDLSLGNSTKNKRLF